MSQNFVFDKEINQLEICPTIWKSNSNESFTILIFQTPSIFGKETIRSFKLNNILREPFIRNFIIINAHTSLILIFRIHVHLQNTAKQLSMMYAYFSGAAHLCGRYYILSLLKDFYIIIESCLLVLFFVFFDSL